MASTSDAAAAGLQITDITDSYRDRAHRIASGHLPRPACALILEFDARGTPSLVLFGATADMGEREQVALLLNANSVIAAAAAICNEAASN